MKTFKGILGALVGAILPLMILNLLIGGQVVNYIAFGIFGIVMGILSGGLISLCFMDEKPAPVLGGLIAGLAISAGYLAVSFVFHVPLGLESLADMLPVVVCCTFGGVGYKLLSR